MRYFLGTTKSTEVDETFRVQDQTLELLHTNLDVAQNRMKQVYDKKHNDKELEVGDWIYLKLQSYRQRSVECHRNHKLSSWYFGPYRVLERIGAVAYRLELPLGSRVHLVFHISLLKKKVGDQEVVVDQPPHWEFLSTQEPAEILVTRVMAEREEFLVRWKGSTKVKASWETKEVLQTHYPIFPIP